MIKLQERLDFIKNLNIKLINGGINKNCLHVCSIYYSKCVNSTNVYTY